MSNLDGTKSKRTGSLRSAGDVAKNLLDQLATKLQARPTEAIALWPTIVGDQFAGMTRAVKLDAGVLHVAVSHSTVLSILHTSSDKQKWIESFRSHGICVTNIVFRIG